MVEVIDAGAVGIARNTQVLRVTNIGSKLKLMIPFHFGDIRDPLELLFAFNQRAVATPYAQSITKIAAHAVHVEFTQSRNKIVDPGSHSVYRNPSWRYFRRLAYRSPGCT